MQHFIDIVLHIDKHLAQIVNHFGNWSYVILFAVVFAETGLVIFPFLPGDSLIFASGAIAANQDSGLNIWILYVIFLAAAILGDSCNYEIGKHFSQFLMNNKFLRKHVFKQEHLDQTHEFFEKHGASTVIIGRFVPIVRTFVPFIAGSGEMEYKKFFHYNVIGGFLWVTLFLWTGYFFGNIPIVKKHFSLLVIGIIVLSLLPMVYSYFKNKKEANQKKEDD